MREILFQRLWQHHAFVSDNLHTTCGKKVAIESPGQLNSFDGPDFHSASILLDGSRRTGDIELHIQCSDWYAHLHQSDPKYNNVILHVCLSEEQAGPIVCENQKRVPTLVLRPYMHPQWQKKLLEIEQQSQLACSGNLHDISYQVKEHQLRKAASMYFHIKRETMFRWFDAHRTPSDAFLRMFWIALCDALGIPANRDSMQRLATAAWDYPIDQSADPAQYQHLLKDLSRNRTANSVHSINWKNKSGRPANRINIRLKQAADALYFLKTEGFGWFVSRDISMCIQVMKRLPFCRGHRGIVILQTVLLPAMHILGELLYKPELQEQAVLMWMSGELPVPAKVTSVFTKADQTMQVFKHHPGLLPQHRYYCGAGKCTECYIFKNILRG